MASASRPRSHPRSRPSQSPGLSRRDTARRDRHARPRTSACRDAAHASDAPRRYPRRGVAIGSRPPSSYMIWIHRECDHRLTRDLGGTSLAAVLRGLRLAPEGFRQFRAIAQARPSRDPNCDRWVLDRQPRLARRDDDPLSLLARCRAARRSIHGRARAQRPVCLHREYAQRHRDPGASCRRHGPRRADARLGRHEHIAARSGLSRCVRRRGPTPPHFPSAY